MTRLGTRAVLREIRPDPEWPECVRCGELIKYSPPLAQKAYRRRGIPVHVHKVICNVYKRRTWDRLEQFHAACYEAAGEPWGTANTSDPRGET